MRMWKWLVIEVLMTAAVCGGVWLICYYIDAEAAAADIRLFVSIFLAVLLVDPLTALWRKFRQWRRAK